MKKLYGLFIIFSLFYKTNLFAQEELIDGKKDTEIVDEGYNIDQTDNEVENFQENSNQDSSNSSGVEVDGGGGELVSASDNSVRVFGYVDVGFFYAMNQGVGFYKDTTNASGFASSAAGVFLGDYASTYINARHESADFGETDSFMPDPIKSRGAPSFILNEMYLNVVKEVSDSIRLHGAVAFRPRVGSFSGNADIAILDLAYIDFDIDSINSKLSVGKFVGIVGIEYRWRNADSAERWAITPSLLGRYTDGTPIGVKLRGKLLAKRFIYNIGITNGSNFIDSTGLSDKIDQNAFKTISTRVSYDFAFGPLALLEIGLSGEYGAEGRQPSNDVYQSTAGLDLQLAIGALQVRAQYLKLDIEGGGPGSAKKYRGDAGYVEALYSLPSLMPWVNNFGIYGRAGLRKVNEIDNKYIFVVDVMRFTGGMRVDITEAVLFKAEYIHNLERGVITSFNNDVVTTSLVAKF